MWNEIRPTPIRKSGETLNELRLKTDRDLRALLENAIKRGFQELRSGDHARVETAYAQAFTLMALVRALPSPELRRLESRLHELHAQLETWKQLAS